MDRKRQQCSILSVELLRKIINLIYNDTIPNVIEHELIMLTCLLLGIINSCYAVITFGSLEKA
jgi:hypothetical protein